MPNGFIVGHITPVLKRGKSTDHSESYRTITVACSWLLAITTVEDYSANQIGFLKDLGCQHAHRILSNILVDVQSKNDSLFL